MVLLFTFPLLQLFATQAIVASHECTLTLLKLYGSDAVMSDYVAPLPFCAFALIHLLLLSFSLMVVHCTYAEVRPRDPLTRTSHNTELMPQPIYTFLWPPPMHWSSSPRHGAPFRWTVQTVHAADTVIAGGPGWVPPPAYGARRHISVPRGLADDPCPRLTSSACGCAATSDARQLGVGRAVHEGENPLRAQPRSPSAVL